jgi:hypothetical protein
MTELPVKVTFLEDKDVIKSYDEKYYIYLDNINPDTLVELNTLINIELDNDAYEIYLKAIGLESAEEDLENYTVMWGMSNLNFVDADIPEMLQDVAQGIIKDVIKDIFERFDEEANDDECF